MPKGITRTRNFSERLWELSFGKYFTRASWLLMALTSLWINLFSDEKSNCVWELTFIFALGFVTKLLLEPRAEMYTVGIVILGEVILVGFAYFVFPFSLLEFVLIYLIERALCVLVYCLMKRCLRAMRR